MHQSCVLWPSVYIEQVWEREQPRNGRTHLERPGDACGTVIFQVGLCVPHVCISSLWQDRLSSGDLPLLSSLLWSQPCQSRFTNAFMADVKAKPMATRGVGGVGTEIRVIFSWREKKKKVCIKRKCYPLNMIWDSYLTWFFSETLFSTLQHII